MTRAQDACSPAGAQRSGVCPCIWMSAGLLTYKLCDREYDCDRCPLDAALRGGSPPRDPGPEPVCPAVLFPEDRLYTPGHTWLQAPAAAATLRLGLDGFAAVLLGRPLEVRFPRRGARLQRGETACEVRLAAGALPLASPIAARLRRGNQRLDLELDLLAGSPYDDGWLVELEPREPAEAAGLVAAALARQRAGLDVRRFRRQVAFHLLNDLGPTLQDGGTPLTDLRRILGHRAYLDLLREFVH